MILVLVVAVKSLSNAMVQLKNVPMCQFYDVTIKFESLKISQFENEYFYLVF
jgi:hypothetical protein